MTSPSVSVIIPTYNRARLIGRALNSVLAQTFQNFEVIVVDDGSTDELARECAQYGSRIQYVWQKNAGAAAARNTGVGHARNPWVAFLDSDDYWTPTHLERIAAAINDTSGQANYYFCDMQMGEADATATLWRMVGFEPPQLVCVKRDGTNWVFLKRQPTMLQCSVFRKDVLIQSGGLDCRFRTMEDTELFFRLGIRGAICAVSSIGCVYTDDDSTDARLTKSIVGNQISYWRQNLLLWQSVSRRFPHLEVQYREVVRQHVASARWRLCRLNWSSRNLLRSLQQFAMCALTSPVYVISLIRCGRADTNLLTIFPEYDA